MTNPTKTPKPAAPGEPAAVPKSRRLDIRLQDGATEDQYMADLVAKGQATNASTAMRFVYGEHGELSLNDMVAAVQKHSAAVNRGDLASLEGMLASQAVALNAIFAELARRAAMNMGEHLSATEAYMRLALKAQAQTRSTVEALAAIKNPPMVYARQANINNGGQQQVNNGTSLNSTPARAGVRESIDARSELLEATNGERLEFGAKGEAGGSHQGMAPVGGVNRSADRGG